MSRTVEACTLNFRLAQRLWENLLRSSESSEALNVGQPGAESVQSTMYWRPAEPSAAPTSPAPKSSLLLGPQSEGSCSTSVGQRPSIRGEPLTPRLMRQDLGAGSSRDRHTQISHLPLNLGKREADSYSQKSV